MGPATIEAGRYEAQRRTEERHPRSPRRTAEPLQWRAKATHNTADHLQVGGPLACRYEDGCWHVVYLGRYGSHGYGNARKLAGPCGGLTQAKEAAARIVATAKARRKA